MRILVTGGCGFIGSHLVERLVKDRNKVFIVDNFTTNAIDEDYFDRNEVQVSPNDVRDYYGLSEVFNRFKPEHVVHLAAMSRIQPSIDDPRTCHDINVGGTLNVLECSRRFGVKKIVFSSSSSVYGDMPIPNNEKSDVDFKNPYSCSKFIGESYFKLYHGLYGLESVILRFFNVYGPRQPVSGAYATVIGIFLNQMLQKESLTVVGDGDQRRDFTFVLDVVEAVVKSIKSPFGSAEILNIGSGVNHSVNQVADMIGGERTYLPERLGEARETLADITRARELLEWEPKTNLVDGVEFCSREMKEGSNE